MLRHSRVLSLHLGRATHDGTIMGDDIGWNEAQFGILFCEPARFFLSSVVRSSCQDFSLIITDKNVLFRFLLIVINFWFLGLSRCVFVPKFWFQIICRFRIVGFKFACRFRFVIFRVWYWEFSWIEFRIYVFQAVVYGTVFQQSQRVSPVRALSLVLVTVLPFSYLLRKPSTIWHETSEIKNSETGVLGTQKLELGNAVIYVTRVQFWSWWIFAEPTNKNATENLTWATFWSTFHSPKLISLVYLEGVQITLLEYIRIAIAILHHKKLQPVDKNWSKVHFPTSARETVNFQRFTWPLCSCLPGNDQKGLKSGKVNGTTMIFPDTCSSPEWWQPEKEETMCVSLGLLGYQSVE